MCSCVCALVDWMVCVKTRNCGTLSQPSLHLHLARNVTDKLMKS